MQKKITISLYLLSVFLLPSFIILQVTDALSAKKHYLQSANNISSTFTSVLGSETEPVSQGLVAADTTCAPPSTKLGKATINISVSLAGTYKIWSRMKAKDTSSNSYWLTIDGGCPINVGDLATMPTNSWVWVDYQSGIPTNSVVQQLSSGTHTLNIIGKEANLKLDKLILTQELSCVPKDLGNNCLVSPTATVTIAPTSILTSTPTIKPINTPTIKLTPALIQSPSPKLTSQSPTPTLMPFTLWDVEERNILTTEATFTWNTNHPSNSWVEYGTSRENLSFKSAKNQTQTKEHSVTIKGLSPKTEYYYRVYSTDSSGETRNSSAKNFTTKALQ